MVENFLNFVKDINIQIQEAIETLNKHIYINTNSHDNYNSGY